MSSCWRILLVLSAVLATACSSLAPYRQYEIRFDAPATPALGGSPSDSERIDAIAWLMHHRLDLPDGLNKIAGKKSEEARERRFAVGVA
jgi:hypothetical protein